MLMLPEPSESAPAAESGCVEAGDCEFGEVVEGFGVGVGVDGSGVGAVACLGWALGFGAVVFMGARPGE
jgi:hypothetical protein